MRLGCRSETSTTADLTWSLDRQEGAELALDHLALGGLPTSLVPPRLDLSRVHEGALPAGAFVGDRIEASRLTLGSDRVPARLFLAHYDLRGDAVGSNDRRSRIRLAGVEIALDRESRPLLLLPASQVRVGLAYVFDPPLEDEVTAWAAIAWSL